ncbi:protein of unknown function (plasmid) [Streptantibioticus cattleyicolor NRRL 8057 = DSM 46488]|nr:protein of unknown function [Streptantibioticus cattleyicolor NRRL 8057 = DSM 46488]
MAESYGTARYREMKMKTNYV